MAANQCYNRQGAVWRCSVNAGEFAKRRALIEHEDGRRRGYKRKALKSLVKEAKAARVFIGDKMVGWRLPNGQTVCLKRRYPSSDAAADALAAIADCPRTKVIPWRAYECPFCKGWHLTHQPPANDN